MTISIENLELDDINEEEPLSNIINLKLNTPDTTALNRNLIATQEVTPDQAAKDRNLSGRTGIPTDIVSIDPQTTQRNADEQEMQSLVKDSPGTLKFLSVIDNMAISKDDYVNLNETENILVKSAKGFAKGTAKGLGRVPFNLAEFTTTTTGYSSMLAGNLYSHSIGLLEKGIAAIIGTEAGADKYLTVMAEYVKDASFSASDEITQIKDSIDVLQLSEDIKGKRLWDNPWLLLNPEYATYQFLEVGSSIAPVIAMALATGGSTVAGSLVGAAMEAGSLYKQLIDEGVSEDRAMGAATSFAPVVVALNKLGLDKMIKPKGAATLFGRAKASGIGGFVEGTTELAEEPAQAFFAALAKGKSWEETWADVYEARKNVEVLFGAGSMGSVTAAATYQNQVKNNLIKGERSEIDRLVFHALDTAVKNSKTLERLPSAYKEFVNNVIEENEGSVKSVFVDSELFQRAVDESKLPEALDIELDNTGGDIEIPISDYAAHIAGTDLSLKIRNDVKFSENGYSIRESEAFRQELQSDIAQETKESKETARLIAQAETENKTIYDEIYKDRIETGRVIKSASTDAEMFTAQVATLAKKYKMSPLEMWRTVKPQIIGGEFVPQAAKESKTLLQSDLFKGDPKSVIDDFNKKYPEYNLKYDGKTEMPKIMGDRPPMYNFTPQKGSSIEGATMAISDGVFTVEAIKAKIDTKVEQFKGDIIQTETPAFKNWFGDSKVVDEDGKPLVVYHGTREEFYIFNEQKSSDIGIHFGDSEAANSIIKYSSTGRIIPVYITLKNPIEVIDIFSNPEISFNEVINSIIQGLDEIDANLSTNDENIMEDLAVDADESTENIEDYRVKHDTDEVKMFWDKVSEILPKYTDGFIYENNYEHGTSYVVLDPTQIKSATENIGTFDSTDPDIRYQTVDPAEGKETLEQFIEENRKEKLSSLDLTHRWRYPNVRGGWSEKKIKRELKKVSSGKSKASFNREITKFNSPAELEKNLFYHGSGGGIGALKPGIVLKDIDRIGGGGYGESYWGISLSKDRNTASNFTAQSSFGNVAPVILKKGAVLKELPEIEDAAEIEDIIVDLWDEGVDAVKIGDWDSEYSEQEIVILNPRAIVVGESTSFSVFKKEKQPSFTKEQIVKMYDGAMEEYKKAMKQNWENRNVSFKAKYGRDLKPFWGSKSKAVERRFKEVQKLTKLYNKGILFQDKAIPKGAYTKSKNLISMFETANESTFLHESGHLFFSFMGDMANQANAPIELKQDWDIVLDYVDGKKGKPLTTKQHETLAKTLEAYFMEGKAPSIKLAEVFKSFKDWLLKIYQTVTNLGVEPTDEIRGVMDRMFASKREIEEANFYYGAQEPFIQDLEKAEQRTYNKLKTKAQTVSEDKTFLKYVKGHISNLGGREKLKKDSHKKISQQPVYKAMDTAVKEGGMPIDIVDTIIGKEARVALGKKRPSMLTKKGILDPAKLAEENGFKSPGQMFSEMSKVEKKRDAVNTLYNQSIQEAEETVRKGLSDDQAPTGSEEYHSNERMAVIQADIQLIQARQRSKDNLAKGRLSARRAQIEKKAIRDIARQVLATKTVKEAIRYSKFSTTEAKASKLAKQAIKNNKLDQAEKHKRQELLNHALVLESIKLREEVNKGRNYVKKQLNSKAINQEALDLITDISARFGLKTQPGKHADNVQSYIAWTNQKNAEGEPRKDIDFNVWEEIQIAKGYAVGLSDEVKDRSNSLEYKDLSIEAFRGVINSVKQIAKNDLLERQITVAGKKVKLDDVVNQLIEQMGKTYDRTERDHFNKTWKNPIETIDARLVKMEQLFKALDGGKLGIFHEALFQPIADAEANENIMVVEANDTIKELFDNQFSKIEQHKMFGGKKEIPGINSHLTRSQLIRVGLDMGNKGNYQRRMVGEGWDHAQMLAVKDKLNKADWDFIQSVWDYIGTFKTDSFALEERMTGRVPEEIIPSEVVTKYGVYKGGYFPVVTDPEFSTIAQSRLEQEQALLFHSGNYSHAMTKHSHLKQRMKTAGGQALNLYLTDITQHVSGVIHDLTHREAVVDIAKVLRHPAFDTALREHIGVEVSNQLMPWLKDIANPDPVVSIGERWAKSIRIGVTVMYLGTISVMAQQLAGFTQSIHKLGGDSWRLIPAIASNPVSMYKAITAKSKMMETRISHYNREAHDAFKNVEMYKKLPAKIGQFSMNMIGVLQLLVDMPTWTAAYNQSIVKDGNETKAVQYADHMIRITQGSGGVKDLATVQRGNNYVRLATMFYSFMNTAYNIFTAPMRGKHINFTELSSALLLVGLIGPMAAELLSGRPPEEDENWAEWAANIELRFFTGLLPVFRDIASAALTPYGYQISPVGSSLNITGKGVYYAVKNKDIKKLVRPASEVGGMVFKMPTHLMLKSGETFWDWMSGEPDIEIQEFFYGRKR